MTVPAEFTNRIERATRAGQNLWLNLTDPANLDVRLGIEFDGDTVTLHALGHHVIVPAERAETIHAALTGWLDHRNGGTT